MKPSQNPPLPTRLEPAPSAMFREEPAGRPVQTRRRANLEQEILGQTHHRLQLDI